MRIRLVVLVACLLPSAGECAAPFVECRQGQAAFEMLEAARKAVTSAGPEVDLWLMRPVKWKPREKVRTADTLTCEEVAAARVFCQFDRWMGCSGGEWPRRQYPDAPLLIADGKSASFLVAPLFTSSSPYFRSSDAFQDPAPRDGGEVPSVSLDSRRLKLHLSTSGVGPWDTAITEVWLTRDGWTWHRYQSEQHCASHVVTLPSEGRYGLRVVVQDVDGPASAPPRVGDAPQLWVEVDETLPVIGTPKRRVADGNVYLYHEGRDLRGEAKPAKTSSMGHPRAEIVRVDAEKIEPKETPPLFIWMR